MTALTPAADRDRPSGSAPRSVRWQPLVLGALRQRRTALIAFAVLVILAAIAMAVTGLVLHRPGPSVFSAGPHSRYHLFEIAFNTAKALLLLLPVLAGLFVGAPMVAREFETGSARFTWTQAAGRTRWLLASALPVALALAIAGIGLGLEFRWWARPLLTPNWPWLGELFGLNPLPYAGWMLFGFSLAVFLGAAIRRTVPAMAAALVSSVAVMVVVAIERLRVYLPPLHRALPATITADGGYAVSLTYRPGAGPSILGTALGWPDGRLLTQAQLHHGAAWFRLHHIAAWESYQPASRLGPLELIEFGWLAVASVLLIAATVALIGRRAA